MVKEISRKNGKSVYLKDGEPVNFISPNGNVFIKDGSVSTDESVDTYYLQNNTTLSTSNEIVDGLTEDKNTLGGDEGGGKYTINKDGTYLVCGSVRVTGLTAGNELITHLYLNNNPVDVAITPAGNTGYATTSPVVATPLAAGDTIWMETRGISGGTIESGLKNTSLRVLRA